MGPHHQDEGMPAAEEALTAAVAPAVARFLMGDHSGSSLPPVPDTTQAAVGPAYAAVFNPER